LEAVVAVILFASKLFVQIIVSFRNHLIVTCHPTKND